MRNMNQPPKTLTKADLAEKIHEKYGEQRDLSKATSMRVVEALFQKMEKNLSQGHEVKISSFGSFVIRKKNARVGRNPKTGVEAPIAQRQVVTFRASQALKNYLNGD